MVVPTVSTSTRYGSDTALAVDVRGLTKEFGRVPALCGLDLQVPRGGSHCLTGPSGSGKTTALSIVAGLAHPTRGTVRISGIDLTRDAVHTRHQIGFLRQQPRFYTWMTGRETLQFSARFFSLSAVRRQQREHELLDLAGLMNEADLTVEEYTAGMRQRLGIAEALIGRPDLLLLDEPAAGLDAGERSLIATTIEQLHGRVTVIFTAGNTGELHHLADQITVLHGSGSRQRVPYNERQGTGQPEPDQTRTAGGGRWKVSSSSPVTTRRSGW